MWAEDSSSGPHPRRPIVVRALVVPAEMHPGCVQTLGPVFQQQWSPVSGEPRTDKRSKEVPAGPW